MLESESKSKSYTFNMLSFSKFGSETLVFTISFCFVAKISESVVKYFSRFLLLVNSVLFVLLLKIESFVSGTIFIDFNLIGLSLIILITHLSKE